jgi:hypothetical protein
LLCHLDQLKQFTDEAQSQNLASSVSSACGKACTDTTYFIASIPEGKQSLFIELQTNNDMDVEIWSTVSTTPIVFSTTASCGKNCYEKTWYYATSSNSTATPFISSSKKSVTYTSEIGTSMDISVCVDSCAEGLTVTVRAPASSSSTPVLACTHTLRAKH